MKKLNKYDDFLFDSLLEGINEGEMPFVLSDRLEKLLNNLNHTIAHKLLDDDNDRSYQKLTLLDYDNDREDMFTFTTSPKLIQHYIDKFGIDGRVIKTKFRSDLSFKDKDLWDMNRSSMKIGRLINKLYPDLYPANGKPGEDIESFVDLIKSSRTKTEGNFKIVKGKDIIKYYDKSSYESDINGSTLAGSCMAHSHCSRYIEFYADNDVEMVILMSEKEEDKIIGRAILWKIKRVFDKNTDEYRDLYDNNSDIDVTYNTERIFMDRIYYTKQSDIGKFKELSEKNNWLSKSTQDYDSYTTIYDPKTGTSKSLLLYTKLNEDYSGPYPYMDTMKYYHKDDNILTNNRDGNYDIELTSVGGGYEEYQGGDYLWNDSYGEFVNHNDMMWSDTEERYLYSDESIWVNDLNSYVSEEYAESKLAYITDEEEWVKRENAVFIDSNSEWVSTDYAMENYAFCDYYDKYYDYDECYPSEKWGCAPFNTAIKVFTTLDLDWEEVEDDGNSFDVGSYADWRIKGDDTYFDIENDKGKLYYFDEEFADRYDKITEIINKDI